MPPQRTATDRPAARLTCATLLPCDRLQSYGLHLLPESGGEQLLQDNLFAVLNHAPQPPELRYGMAYSSHGPRGEPGLLQPQVGPQGLEYPQQKSRGRLHGNGRPAGADLSASPSLPMLSPGRPGARNWVTFLHG